MSEEEVIVEDTDIQEATATPEVSPGHIEPDPQEATATPDDVEESIMDQSEVADPNPEESVDDTNWQKRFEDGQKYINELTASQSHYKSQLEQYAQLGDPQQAAQQLQQFREQAERQELKAWNSRSPEYAQFQELQGRAKVYSDLLQNASPEGRAAIQAEVGGKFSDAEQQLISDYHNHQQSVQRQLAEDPDGFINNVVQDRITQALQEYEEYQNTRYQTDQYLDQNSTLIDKHGDDFMRIVGNQVPPRELAVEFVQMKEELAQLRGENGKSVEASIQANAQQAALKKSASVNRDLNTEAPDFDPVTKANELGLTGVKRLRYLNQHSQAS